MPSPPSDPTEESPLVNVGLIVKPFGLRGRVVVEPLTDFPERFAPGSALLIAGERYQVTAGRAQKGRWVLKLKGVDKPEQAEELRGLYMQVHESELFPLPKGEYYRFQVVGLLAVTPDGEEVGRVAEVLQTGANDVYLIIGPGGERLVPALPQFVREVDLEAGRMVLEDTQFA